MKRVLIVDDKEENLYYMRALLTAHGWEVEDARHGAEALMKARKAPPDLVVSDLLMPVMDGYTLLRHWKADDRLKHAPFIVYTATYTEADDETLALNLGADAFILKPAEPDEFLAQLRVVEANASAAVPVGPRIPEDDEEGMLKVYSKALIRKLEDKSLQLEETNRALQRDITERKRAEARLLRSEEAQRFLAETQLSVLDALPAHIALVDADGLIISVNKSWRRFALANSIQGQDFGIGQNYLAICEGSTGECSEGAETAAYGLRRVLRGESREFASEYPCHSPTEKRWFRLMVAPLREERRLGAVIMHINITERRQAEEALRESLERFQAVARAANDTVWNWDLATDEIWWSEGFHATFGYRPDEVEASIESWFGRLHPDERARIVQGIKKVIQGSDSMWSAEYRFRRGDGSYADVLDRGCVLRDAEGRGVRIVGAIQDISARKRVAQRLRALNRTYAVSSAINQLIVRQNNQEAILTGACRIAVEMGGFRLAWVGLTGAAGEPLRLAAHAGASPDAMAVLNGIVDDRPPQCPCTLEAVATGRHAICNDISRDTPHAPWHAAAAQHGYRAMVSLPLLIAERPVGVFNLYADQEGFFDADELQLLDGLATDIGFALDVSQRETERQRAVDRLRDSEERFRELAETIQEVFCMTDPATNRILYISPAYEKIWGRTCASLYQAPQTWLEAVHPDDRSGVQHATATQLTAGDFDETYRILRPDGTLRWVHDRRFPVRDPAGEVIRIVGATEDVTNRRQLEEQFRRAQKMEAIGQLAGGIAHDFNNILAAILGNTELACAETRDGDPARVNLDEIKKASIRAKSLVQQILAFSRQQPQERRVTDLGPIVHETVKFLRATIPSIVELVISIDAATPGVLADPTQIHQVIANLCTNAWHALDDQPGRIEVRLESFNLDSVAASRLAGLKSGRVVCLSVTDMGKGMDTVTLERVFDPFFTTKEPGKGTGLGLSVVHGIVEGHDGAITVSSRPGEGTKFQVYFPAAVPAGIPSPTASKALGTGKGQHILFLDDEESLVLLAKRVVERLGYRVTAFTRSTDAVRTFREDPARFDLIITDLYMPGASGLHIASELLKLRPGLPVMLCSGHVTDELRQRARDAGISEVLHKPNTMEELSEAIHRLLNRASRA